MKAIHIIESVKPGIPKRFLLFMAALAWTVAGGMLLYKGISIIVRLNYFSWIRVSLCATGGILFYILLFSKISARHVKRIINLKYKLPCMFSFFNLRSYAIMAVMITSGVLLRKSGAITPQHLSNLYITMGIPLFMSAFRFYYYGFRYHSLALPE
jgi:hypothetical protein